MAPQDLLKKYEIPSPPCGAQIPEEWIPLVESLIVDLLAMGWDRDLQQVKSKFGGLRFYTGPVSEECQARISVAEAASLDIPVS